MKVPEKAPFVGVRHVPLPLGVPPSTVKSWKAACVLHTVMELRAPLEFALLPSSLPWLLTAPRGDGHPVLLVPGFLSSEAPLLAMQAFLRNRGYTVDRCHARSCSGPPMD